MLQKLPRLWLAEGEHHGFKWVHALGTHPGASVGPGVGLRIVSSVLFQVSYSDHTESKRSVVGQGVSTATERRTRCAAWCIGSCCSARGTAGYLRSK